MPRSSVTHVGVLCLSRCIELFMLCLLILTTYFKNINFVMVMFQIIADVEKILYEYSMLNIVGGSTAANTC